MEQMEDHSDNIYISIYFDHHDDQFSEVLKKIWIGLAAIDKTATFNYIGLTKNNKFPLRPSSLQKNPLGNLGLSIVCQNPLAENIIYTNSDYRDPCFYSAGKLILAASSDHRLIYATISEAFVRSLEMEYKITRESGNFEDI